MAKLAQRSTRAAFAVLVASFLLVALPMHSDAAKDRGGRGAQSHPQQGGVYALPGGGQLKVPRGSLSRGAQIRVGIAGRKARRAARKARRDLLKKLGKTVSLHVVGGRLTGPVKLSFPFPAGIGTKVFGPEETVQLAYYDERRRRWQTVPTAIDANRRVATTTIRLGKRSKKTGKRGSRGAGKSDVRQPMITLPKLSLPKSWGRFEWNWDGILLGLDQRIGQLRGARTGPAKCTSGVPVPAWAEVTVNNGDDLPIRTCAEGQDGKVVVQIVNNRPYSVVLRYGAPVAWGWHAVPDGIIGASLAAMGDATVSPNELYVPPLSAASVGVPIGSWGFALFQASLNSKSLATDLIGLIAAEADVPIRRAVAGKLAAACSAILTTGKDGSPQITAKNFFEWVTKIAGCIRNALPALAGGGLLDSLSLSKLTRVSDVLKALKKASAAYHVAKLAGAFADIYVSTLPDMGNATFAVANKRNRSGKTLVYQYRSAGNPSAGDLEFTDWAKATGREVELAQTMPGDLSAYRCVVLDDNQGFELTTEFFLKNYLRDGGTVISIGEHEGFGSNSALNAMGGWLGSHISLDEVQDSGGNTYSSNIASSPYTAGVSEFGYNWVTTLAVSPPAQTLVYDAYGGTDSLLAAEQLRGGLFVVSADSNAFSDNNNGFYDDADNDVLVRNLCG